MKIAFLTWQFPNWHNTFTLNELIEIERAGHQITVFSVEPSPGGVTSGHNWKVHYFDEFANESCRKGIFGAIRFKYDTGPGIGKRFFDRFEERFFSFRNIARVIRDYDVIHAAFGNRPATAAMILSRLSGVPFTFETHAYDLFVDFPFAEEKIRGAERIFTISNYNRNYLIERYKCPPSKIVVKRVTFNQEYCEGFLNKKKVDNLIVSACRFHPIKALDRAIESFGVLYKKSKSLRYIIAGDGELRNELEEKVKKMRLSRAVIFPGRLSNKEVLDHIAQATIFLSLSTISEDGDRDGIPTSLVEAMYLRTPVISTGISGIPELIDDGIHGFLVDPEDVHRVADTMQRLLDDRDLREKLGENGRARIIEEYDVVKNMEKMKKVWQLF